MRGDEPLARRHATAHQHIKDPVCRRHILDRPRTTLQRHLDILERELGWLRRADPEPDRPGTIAELYEGQELPGMLVWLMTDTPWCDEVQEYVPMDDPARIHLTPKAGC